LIWSGLRVSQVETWKPVSLSM